MYVVEMGIGAILYIRNFVKIASDIQRIHIQHCNLVSLHLFLKIRKIG
jgi:hypothetical protein